MFLKLMSERRLFAPEDGAGSAAAGEGGQGAADASASAGEAGKGQESLLGGAGAATEQQGAAKDADKAADPADKTGGEDSKGDQTEGDGKKAEGDEAKPDPLKEVPEDGKYEFTMPDGVELDTEFAERASPALKEAGVTREQANKLAQFMAEDRKAQAENWARTQEDWVKSARTDKEYGGDKFDASIKGARRVLDKYGTPELKEYLTASGGGNHPEIIRLLARVGNDISDDKPVGSGDRAVARDSLATLYPNDLKGK